MVGLIYKLSGGGLDYYGSTEQTLNKRLNQHKSKYKKYLEGKTNYLTSFDIIDKNDYNIELVEEVEDLAILTQRERYYIENFDCVNKCLPYVSEEEKKQRKRRDDKKYCEKNKEKLKETKKKYRENNKETLKEKTKNYRDNNKEKIKAKDKKYWENNKEKIKEYKKIYSEQNKEKIKEKKKIYRENNDEKLKAYKNEKIECPNCKKLVSRSNLRRHQKNSNCNI